MACPAQPPGKAGFVGGVAARIDSVDPAANLQFLGDAIVSALGDRCYAIAADGRLEPRPWPRPCRMSTDRL